MKVPVLMGGKSAEREISIKTGKAILRALEEKGVETWPVDPAEENFVEKLKGADVVFIALHGRLGEDGTVQGLLEILGIPYTGSGVLASALALNKVYAKQIFWFNQVPTADFEILNLETENPDDFPKKLDFPVVVKPAMEGSSIGLSMVENKNEFIKAIEEASKYDKVLLIEKKLSGKELTVGIIGNQKPQVLPVIEIKPKVESFFSFKSKYTKGMTEYLVPAPIGEKATQLAQKIALKAYRALGCRGMGRVDMILDESDGVPKVLEINTIPGMTETSLLPMAARAAGMSFADLVMKIVEYALEKP